MQLYLFDSPFVMAWQCADEIWPQIGRTCPGIIFFGKKLLVWKRFRQRHHLFMGFIKEVFGGFKRRVLMTLPNHNIHFAVCFPWIIWRQKRNCRNIFIFRHIVFDEFQEQQLPFIKMHKYIADVFVTLPMRLGFLGIARKIKRCIHLIFRHLRNHFQKFGIVFGWKFQQIFFTSCSWHSGNFLWFMIGKNKKNYSTRTKYYKNNYLWNEKLY